MLDSHTRQIDTIDTTTMKRAWKDNEKKKEEKKKEQPREDKTEVPPWDGQQ